MCNDNEQYVFNVVITDCRYYNEDSGWGVYKFSTEDDIPYYVKCDIPFDKEESKSDKKFGTLAGKMQELNVGAEYKVTATFKNDKKYGDQYVPKSVYALMPKSKESQITFLKSLIPERIAENLIKAYPNIVNDVANGVIDTIDYSKVSGVREATWNKIKDKIVNNYVISDIINLLMPLGVTYTMIKKLLDHESNPTLLKEKLKNNPWILTEINGLGFKRVDELALKLKPEKINSLERLIAYTRYFFTTMGEEDGHTWCDIEIFKSSVSSVVPECLSQLEKVFSIENLLYINGNKVGLKYYHDLEMKIFHLIKLKSIMKTNINLSEEKINHAIKDAEKEQGFEYGQDQVDLINKSLNRTVSIITGKAGCGKTSIMRAIIKAYYYNGYKVSLSALSAMAAKRITEATGYEGMTIHRTLGCKGFNDFEYNSKNPLPYNVVFCDEGSMINAKLFYDWLVSIGDNSRIIISGDYKQLPPIGYGNIFSDLIRVLDDSIVGELTKPMRQAEKSGILTDANLIRNNKNPIREGPIPKIVHGELKDMVYMFRTNRQSLFDIAVKTYMKSIETDNVDDVAIIVPRKKNCLNSTQELNKTIQDLVLKDEAQYIDGFDTRFKLGAKVMQTVNDYQNNVFNGEIGYITCIEDEKCYVTFKSPGETEKVIEYKKQDLSNLDLAYAMTTHKMQGSGIKTVIGIIDNTHYQLLDNCMLYTLLTRAKKRCLLLAEPGAFLRCIKNTNNARNTWILQEGRDK